MEAQITPTTLRMVAARAAKSNGRDIANTTISATDGAMTTSAVATARGATNIRSASTSITSITSQRTSEYMRRRVQGSMLPKRAGRNKESRAAHLKFSVNRQHAQVEVSRWNVEVRPRSVFSSQYLLSAHRRTVFVWLRNNSVRQSRAIGPLYLLLSGGE